LPWIKKHLAHPRESRRLLGDETLSLEQCFCQLGLSPSRVEQRVIDCVLDLANRDRNDPAVPGLFEQAIEWFPHYYRSIEMALTRVVARMQALSRRLSTRCTPSSRRT